MDRAAKLTSLKMIDDALEEIARQLTYHGLTELPSVREAAFRVDEAQMHIQRGRSALEHETE